MISEGWLMARLWPLRSVAVAALLCFTAIMPQTRASFPLVGALSVAYLGLRRLLNHVSAITTRGAALIGLDLVAVTAIIPVTGGEQSPSRYLYLLALVGGALSPHSLPRSLWQLPCYHPRHA
ncbi:MAG: hypothetical protein ACYCYK_12075 [Candidatus Dormibacteria bacterium]